MCPRRPIQARRLNPASHGGELRRAGSCCPQLRPRLELRMPRQHDYEPQPEAPDLGSTVQLETSESLVAPPGVDGLDSGYVAADRPYLLDERRITAAELSEPETLDERLARERPD